MDISCPTTETKNVSPNDKIPIKNMDVFTKRTYSEEKTDPKRKVSPMKEALSPVKSPEPYKL